MRRRRLGPKEGDVLEFDFDFGDVLYTVKATYTSNGVGGERGWWIDDLSPEPPTESLRCDIVELAEDLCEQHRRDDEEEFAAYCDEIRKERMEEDW